jgi:peptidoglycan-associated lipoprotein
MPFTRRIAALTVAVLATSTVACHKKPEAAPTPVQSATLVAPNADSARLAQQREAQRLADEAARRRTADSIAAANAGRDGGAASATLRATLTTPIHFDYDQSDLRGDDRAILDAKIPILQANSGVMIRIAGNTDDRGSDEYNLALGQRRAATAKAYLVQRGIPESRIETVSYGEERPVAQGSDETAYAQNRRAEFEITAGGQTLRRP